MKKVLYFALIFPLYFAFSGCERELESENVSGIIYFPVVEMTGDPIILLDVGGTYTEPGVIATVGGEEVDVTISGTVDPTTPGVYTITYTAMNAEGYSASNARLVGVIDAEAKADDLSGSYQRNAGARGISVWTKVADGLYQVNDMGGATNEEDFVYAFNIRKNVIVVPNQPLSGNGSDITCVNADAGPEIEFTPGPAGTESYKWIVLNIGYGTALRTFVKVE